MGQFIYIHNCLEFQWLDSTVTKSSHRPLPPISAVRVALIPPGLANLAVTLVTPNQFPTFGLLSYRIVCYHVIQLQASPRTARGQFEQSILLVPSTSHQSIRRPARTSPENLHQDDFVIPDIHRTSKFTVISSRYESRRQACPRGQSVRF
jgi:hypothetical protein